MDRCEVQIPRGDCTNRPLTQRRRAGFSGVYPFRSTPVPRSARGRYGRFDRSSMRAHSFRSVFGTTFLRRQTLFRQASGSSLQHMRCRRQRLSVQDRNDPNRSACARQTHRMRWRNGIASHPSSVRRPGKLRLPMCKCFSFVLLPAPRGEGRTIRSSRSERRMVGGASDSPIFPQRQRSSTSDAPSTTLRHSRRFASAYFM